MKLIDEINWYKSIPKEISNLVPKILETSTEKNPFIKLEYIKHPTLSELWLYGEFSLEFWKQVIEDLFNMIQKFRKYNKPVTKQEYDAIYLEKTSNRIDELIQTNNFFKKIFEYSVLEKQFIITNFNEELKDLHSQILIAKDKNQFKEMILEQSKAPYDTKPLKEFALNYNWLKISHKYRNFIQSMIKK